jgi:hypothetical protein
MTIVDINAWFRNGRGLRFQFKATDDGIINILEGCLLDISPGKFYILATFFNKIGKQYVPSSRKIEAKDIPIYSKNDIWSFFIGHDDITPYSVFSGVDDIDFLAPINGLINLQYGRNTRQGVALPTIGMVNRISNLNTNEVIEHKEYVHVFRQCVRHMKKKGIAVSCATIQ